MLLRVHLVTAKGGVLFGLKKKKKRLWFVSSKKSIKKETNKKNQPYNVYQQIISLFSLSILNK